MWEVLAVAGWRGRFMSRWTVAVGAVRHGSGVEWPRQRGHWPPTRQPLADRSSVSPAATHTLSPLSHSVARLSSCTARRWLPKLVPQGACVVTGRVGTLARWSVEVSSGCNRRRSAFTVHWRSAARSDALERLIATTDIHQRRARLWTSGLNQRLPIIWTVDFYRWRI